MLQTHRTTYESGLRAKQVEVSLSLHRPTSERLTGAWHRQASENAIDDALAASFPASDPPGWNPGLARSGSIDRLPDQETDGLSMRVPDENGAGLRDTIEFFHRYDSERPLIQVLISLFGAVGIALVVPLAIVLVGLPIALAVRGLLEVLVWLFPAIG